jgi:MFS family permease
MITVIYAIFAGGTIVTLLRDPFIAPRIGRRGMMLGAVGMMIGLALLVVSVRLSVPNLALFLFGDGLIGAGAGAVFKGTTGVVLETGAPEDRLAMTSSLLVALFVGLSAPVIGAGIALNQGASAPNTVLGFAILVGLGVSVSGWALLGRPPRESDQAAEPDRQRLTWVVDHTVRTMAWNTGRNAIGERVEPPTWHDEMLRRLAVPRSRTTEAGIRSCTQRTPSGPESLEVERRVSLMDARA